MYCKSLYTVDVLCTDVLSTAGQLSWGYQSKFIFLDLEFCFSPESNICSRARVQNLINFQFTEELFVYNSIYYTGKIGVTQLIFSNSIKKAMGERDFVHFAYTPKAYC